MLIAALTLIYSVFTQIMILAWIRMRRYAVKPEQIPTTKISVIIVVRNEEENIISLLKDLTEQTFPPEQLEVIVIDDHSSDATLSQIGLFTKEVNYTLNILQLKDYLSDSAATGNFKKKAIEVGVLQAMGELIVTTDGDCRVGKDWLTVIEQFYTTSQAKFISGPVTFYGEHTFFENLQTVEFASLVGSGASLLQLHMPVMCNGANLAYTKQAFLEVGGYSNTTGSPSGDDIFLLQKINQLYPGRAFFLKSKEAVVYTKPKSSLGDFFQQRKRWTSKWNLYQDKRASLVAIFIFISNFCLMIALGLVLCQLYPLRMFLIQIAIRFSIEFVFLTLVLRFFDKQKNILLIVPLQLVYFLYVSLFGFVTHKKGYEWKGRKLK